MYERQAAKVLAVVQRFYDAFGIRFHGDGSLHDHVPRPAVVALPEHWTTENGVTEHETDGRPVQNVSATRAAASGPVLEKRKRARARQGTLNNRSREEKQINADWPPEVSGRTRVRARAPTVTAFTVC